MVRKTKKETAFSMMLHFAAILDYYRFHYVDVEELAETGIADLSNGDKEEQTISGIDRVRLWTVGKDLIST